MGILTYIIGHVNSFDNCSLLIDKTYELWCNTATPVAGRLRRISNFKFQIFNGLSINQRETAASI